METNNSKNNPQLDYVDLIKFLAVLKSLKPLIEKAYPLIVDSIHKDSFLKAGSLLKIENSKELSPYWMDKLSTKAFSIAKSQLATVSKSLMFFNKLSQGFFEMYGDRFSTSIEVISKSLEDFISISNSEKNILSLEWIDFDESILPFLEKDSHYLAFDPSIKEKFYIFTIDLDNSIKTNYVLDSIKPLKIIKILNIVPFSICNT